MTEERGRTDSLASKGNGSIPEPLRRRLDSESVETVRRQLDEWDRRARTMFRERPIASVAGALVLGYVFGRIFSRRWL